MDPAQELELTVLSLPLMPEFERWMWLLKSDYELLGEFFQVAEKLGVVSPERRLRAYQEWLREDRLASIVSEGRPNRVATEMELQQPQDTPEYRLLSRIASLGPDARIRVWRTLSPGLFECLQLGWGTLELQPQGEPLDDWILTDSRAAVQHLVEECWGPPEKIQHLAGLPLLAPPPPRRSPLQLLEAFGELHPEASRELRLRLPAPWLQRLLETWDGQPPSCAAEDWMEPANLPEVSFWQWGEVAPVEQALALLEICGLRPEPAPEPDLMRVVNLEMETFGIYPLFLLSELPAEDYQKHLAPLLSEEAQRLCPQWAVDGLRQRNAFVFLDEAPPPPWQDWLDGGLAPILAHLEKAARERFPSEALQNLLATGDFEPLRQVTISTFRHLARAFKQSSLEEP